MLYFLFFILKKMSLKLELIEIHLNYFIRFIIFSSIHVIIIILLLFSFFLLSKN